MAQLPSKPAETLFLCSCEDTFSPDADIIASGMAAAGLGAPEIRTCAHLCRSQKGLFEAAIAEGRPVTVACRQEEPLFREIAEAMNFSGALGFADIRNRAGWSNEGANASPKMAALLAQAHRPATALPFISLESAGVALVYGRDETAIEIGRRLADTLDITVLLARPKDVVPPRQNAFPILRGVIRLGKGHLGAFELTIDDFALSLPSSRGTLKFGEARDGATSRCDLVIDVSGGAPLFSAHDLRDGYLRADPGDPLAVERLIAKARDLVGTFDKPKYVTFDTGLCAHSRSKITGCTRCLDVCPAGAISPAGDVVEIDPAICAGCGSCAAVCPTGAAAYALPSTDVLMGSLRTRLRAYAGAGGKAAILLFHDAEHGDALIDALARYGSGLPADVIPVDVNALTQVGIEQIAAGFAYGAAGMAFLTRAKPLHDMLALEKTLELAITLLPPLGYPAEAVTQIATDDPDALLAALMAVPGDIALQNHANFLPANFLPMGGKRQVMMLALREWQAHAPQKPERIALPAGAPFGAVHVEAEGCTLCLACVSTCPVNALSANPERPELRFQEDLCVQCGLCQATCPEKVIHLEPRLDFIGINAPPITLKEEEPYPCDHCGKLFGTKSTIARIKSKLAGKNWMYSGANADRLKLIGYCDDCRIEVATLQGFDPYAGPERPRVRTSEDYFREREQDAEEGKKD